MKLPHISLSEKMKLRFQWFNRPFSLPWRQSRCIRHLDGPPHGGHRGCPVFSLQFSPFTFPTALPPHSGMGHLNKSAVEADVQPRTRVQPSLSFGIPNVPLILRNFLGSHWNRDGERQPWGREGHHLTWTMLSAHTWSSLYSFLLSSLLL